MFVQFLIKNTGNDKIFLFIWSTCERGAFKIANSDHSVFYLSQYSVNSKTNDKIQNHKRC